VSAVAAKTPRVTPVKTWVRSHLQFHLDARHSVADIQRILGPSIEDQGLSGDEKMTHHWEFNVDGLPSAIWDYKGYRWSAFGSETLFAALGFEVVR